MVNHPNRSSKSAPHQCAYCGKPAHKRTEWIWNPHQSGTVESRAHAVEGGTTRETWDYRGNGLVLRRIVEKPGEWGSNSQSFISRVSVWDGETWELRYDPFCTMDCALLFARAAHRSGHRMPGNRSEPPLRQQVSSSR